MKIARLLLNEFLRAASAAAAAQEVELDDADLAAFVESVELASVAAYEAALGSGKIGAPPIVAAANTFVRHHRDHANAVAGHAADKRTGRANGRLAQAFADQISQAKDENAVLRILYDVENAAASTHLLTVARMKDARTLKTSASILPVESQHAVVIGQALGRPLDDLVIKEGFETQARAVAPDDFPITTTTTAAAS